jgi:hypothetical protein
MPLPDEGQVAEFNREAARNVVRCAVLAAEVEAGRRPVPRSSVRNPDGSQQDETRSECDTRLVRTAVLHLLEQGLVVLPPDIAEMLNDWIPLTRAGTD